MLTKMYLFSYSYSVGGFFFVANQVEERLVSLEDLLDADEVFCTGTAVVVAPVSSITYQEQRY